MIYLIGSLANPQIPILAKELDERLTEEIFADWYAPGPEADVRWREYAIARGQSFKEALTEYHAQHVFDFDRRHLARADQVVLVCPAGRSAHLELGWALGYGKPGHILLERFSSRWDVMYNFATSVCRDTAELVDAIRQVLPIRAT